MRQTVEAICTLTALFAVLVANAQVANTPVPRYDLLLKGGHVIDPANGLDGKRDVAVLVGKVAAVEKDIPANEALKVVDVSGLYVTPGLIDIHYHVGHGGAPLNWFAPDSPDHEVPALAALLTADPRSQLAPLGVPADLALQSGVTTIVDAGTRGPETFFKEKKEGFDQGKLRLLPFLTTVAVGMKGELEQTFDQLDLKGVATTALKYPNIIVVLKRLTIGP